MPILLSFVFNFGFLIARVKAQIRAQVKESEMKLKMEIMMSMKSKRAARKKRISDFKPLTVISEEESSYDREWTSSVSFDSDLTSRGLDDYTIASDLVLMVLRNFRHRVRM